MGSGKSTTTKSHVRLFSSSQGNASAVDHVDPRGSERMLVERSQQRMFRKHPGHLRIQIDQRDAFEIRVLQKLTDGQAVASAQNEDPPRFGSDDKPGCTSAS